MKILVTGATGFIGSHLVEKLLTKGHQIRCFTRISSNLGWLQNLNIEYCKGDYFSQQTLVDAVRDVEFIYHTAGVTKAKTIKGYYDGNHIATRNLLEAVISGNPKIKRFIHISSGAAVGPSYDGQPVDERTPFHQITSYGRSKMEAEKECLRLMDKIPITIVRPPAVYGPRDKDVFEFFNTIGKGIQPMIGFKDTFVSLIHVSDLINGIMQASEHPIAVGQTYFISSERFYTWKELGEITAQIMGKKVLRIKIPKSFVYVISTAAEFLSLFSTKPALLNIEKAKDMVQKFWIFKIEKAKIELGFKENMGIEDGISETIKWYRDQGWLKS